MNMDIDPEVHDRRLRALDDAILQLADAPPFAKARHQEQVYRLAGDLADSDDGMRQLLARIPRMLEADVFHGGPWADPSKLLPPLVGYGLVSEGVYPIVEMLSELRMVVLASGAVKDDRADEEFAASFLREVCVQNMNLMFPEASEESRIRPAVYARVERLFRIIRESISMEGLGETLVDEIDAICAQRPILTAHAKKLIEQARSLPVLKVGDEAMKRLDLYFRAVGQVSDASRDAGDVVSYQQMLSRMDDEAIQEEAKAFSDSLKATGLGSPYFAVLLRWLAKRAPHHLGLALGLNDIGMASFSDHQELVAQLVRKCIYPDTTFAILGLAQLLERPLLQRHEVSAGLTRLVDITILPPVAQRLECVVGKSAGLTPNALLLAGAIGVLGRPIGIGQCNEPTCQAARGISLWSQHAPGLLLGMVASAVRDGIVQIKFEGIDVVSEEPVLEKLGRNVNPDLDPLSAVLVPHLDLIYAQMMQLAAGRPDDPHRWVNPALYGQWVSTGFVSAFDTLTGAVKGHQNFLRRYYATHHPEYNDGAELIYPNPVGLIITNVHGKMLGLHAVSLLRISEDPDGELRAYFFNPNNDGRQRWGQNIQPSVSGHGERAGESSLPFDQMASRLYAFHYNPYEEGEAYMVPNGLVERVSDMARESWGKDVVWIE